MRALGATTLLLSLASFVIFFADVAMGAARMGDILGDVGEMLLLLASATLFVIGVLAREADEKSKNQTGRSST